MQEKSPVDAVGADADRRFMKMALDLAERGRGFVNPNPMVGTVIVKNGKVIGQGWHEAYGKPHAERNALAARTGDPRGATLYVTLEPCCHVGKTPPCTDAIIESRIRKVVVGAGDPNPLVAGKGIAQLRQSGIDVETGVLEAECLKQNEVFFHYIKTKQPFVVLKFAMSLDGKIATASGESKWITGEAARKHAHTLRHRYAAIAVGAETAIEDDPMLNCRLPGTKDPIRIVCDTNLRTPLTANLVRTAREIPTYLATACEIPERIQPFADKGCQILQIQKEDGRISFRRLMEVLGEQKVDSVLVEGGAALHDSALRSGMVQKVYAYIAPVILGGDGAKTPVGGMGADKLSEAFRLTNRVAHVLGDDLLLEYEMGQ